MDESDQLGRNSPDRQPMSKRRRELLRELESIVGNAMFNGNIQNRTAGGAYVYSGRDFRYPLTLVDAEGRKTKSRRGLESNSPEEVILGAYYAFGANHLHIGAALAAVVEHLERECGFSVDAPSTRSNH